MFYKLTQANTYIERNFHMKLNHDCIRDILLFVEENVNYNQYADFSAVELKNYSRDEIIYSADKLLEAGFIDGNKISSLGATLPSIRITSITWTGHQFLDNIRDESIWKSTKSVLSHFSSVSLSMVGNVASQVLSAFISKHLGML